ncbi:MAG: histidinol-phosphate transaminase, partial [Clostridia bacterium]|nr:histidinol-phosphate transaminase [Clostridia bacterium]
MSRFFSEKFSALTPYTPGEQPRERTYIKLNTNESPYPPSPIALRMARQAAGNVNLYSDPTCLSIRKTAAERYGIDADEVMFTNGSDDILNFAFMAFCDERHPVVFPDITYGFYPVFAAFNRIPYETIPLQDDFTLRVEDYVGIGKTIFIANPNAPTGIALPLCDIERIVAGNPDNVVVIDEAYVDFGGESAVSLIHKYDNLLVTQTCSKSRNLAGARLGMGFGCKALIQDLNTLRYSTNPYNLDRLALLLGEAAVKDDGYYKANCEKIAATREASAKR